MDKYDELAMQAAVEIAHGMTVEGEPIISNATFIAALLRSVAADAEARAQAAEARADKMEGLAARIMRSQGMDEIDIEKEINKALNAEWDAPTPLDA